MHNNLMNSSDFIGRELLSLLGHTNFGIRSYKLCFVGYIKIPKIFENSTEFIPEWANFCFYIILLNNAVLTNLYLYIELFEL
jgi:hypothetical protein